MIFYTADSSRASTWGDISGGENRVRGYVVESVVPEPGTLGMLSLLALGVFRRSRHS